MFNLLDFVYENCIFQQFKVNDLLFIEYKCVADESLLKVWSKHNYIMYVIKGKKLWQTSQAEYYVKAGEAVFVKKGANIVHQFFDEGFCSLIIFIPDHFIANVIQENFITTPGCHVQNRDSVERLHVDAVLSGYFYSVLAFFANKQAPSKNLLEIKMKELILDLMSSAGNENLSAYFKSLCNKNKTSIREVMENNFIYNMNIKEFAYLCGRSLTSFKRDFLATYDTSPGKWLLQKRLEYVTHLMQVTDKNINELSFESGFENVSHFIKVFKEAHGITPLQYKKSLLVTS
jgi:AraC family transcriptional regulator, exoenzyme S synthesis regulatory protein ExsA